jgi:acetylglutamate kinase
VRETPRRGDLTVLKLGGELLEAGDRLGRLAQRIGALARAGPLLVVHGGGREIDAETARRGLVKRAVDGLRLTDADTLDAVIAVLAGTVNTRLVAALTTAGVRAVGLTGADDRVVMVEKAPPHQATDGRVVDLGLVGHPVGRGAPRLLLDLISAGCVPVLACLGLGADGRLYNVNADTLASHLATATRAARLVIAGATAGVLDPHGRTIPVLDLAGVGRVTRDGSASAGMVAKLEACAGAVERGVAEVAIVDARGDDPFGAPPATRIVAQGEAASASSPDGFDARPTARAGDSAPPGTSPERR